MEQYMKGQDLVKKENIPNIHPLPKPKVRNPGSGPFKARVAQPVETVLDSKNMKKDQIMKAL
eukprot:7754126-Prorocentrum_lima.AAC.1